MATLRLMLEQAADPQLAEASNELARALVAGAPQGCEVEGVVPAGTDATPDGLSSVRRAPLPRRELAAALQLGVATGIGGGMIHSPTLFAPLVRHDRVHDHDQTVVTVWDLRAWEAPGELPRSAVAWQKAMLKRAAKHADAVVVPTHSMAVRLLEIAPKLAGRVRVIAGASPAGFAVPLDEVGRRREMGLPEGYVVLAGESASADEVDAGLRAIASSGVGVPVAVIDVGPVGEPAVAEMAAAAGLPPSSVHVRGFAAAADRAALLGGALALVAPSTRSAFPWRVVDALTLGVPVLAASSAVHEEILLDGGVLVAGTAPRPLQDELGSALASALSSTAATERLAVLASDRGRAFSWREAADKVWGLHADL